MSIRDKHLEIVIAPFAGEAHKIIEVCGHRRTEMAYQSLDHRAIVGEVVRLIKEPDSPYEPRARIYDRRNLVVCRPHTDGLFDLEKLEFLANPESARNTELERFNYRAGRDKTVDLALGRIA